MEQPLRVLNQYHFSPGSATACVAISVMALFHQYDKRPRPLTESEWERVMALGTELYRRWRAQARFATLPTVQDILALPDCARFTAVFGAEPREFAGLVRDAHGQDEPEGDLRAMLRETTRLCQVEGRTVACLLVLPRVICVSLLCEPAPWAGCRIRFFDSHDERSRYCDYQVFASESEALAHILWKYPVEQWRPEFIEEQSVLQAEYAHSYSACLFIK